MLLVSENISNKFKQTIGYGELRSIIICRCRTELDRQNRQDTKSLPSLMLISDQKNDVTTKIAMETPRVLLRVFCLIPEMVNGGLL